MLKKWCDRHHIFYGWVVVACGALVMAVTHGIVQNCFSLYIKPVTESLGFSRQSFSVNQTLINVTYLVVSLLSGKLFSKFKLSGLMRVACIALPVSYFCYSFSTQIWMFYLISIVVGTSTAFLTFLPFTLIMSRWFEEKRGLAIGICFMGSGVGGMLFNALSGIWMVSIGWQAVSQILAVIMAAVMVPVIFLLLRVDPHEMGLQALGSRAENGEAEPTYGYTMKQAVRTASFWEVMVIIFGMGFAATMLSNTIVPHLSDVGFKPTYASSVMSIYLGILSVCKIVLGGLYDKFGMKKVTAAAIIAIIIGLVGLLFGQFAPMHILIIAGAAFGCAACTVGYPILTQAAFGTCAYTAIYGIVSAANQLATSICPIFSNAIYDGSGSYNLSLICGIGLTTLALVLLMLVRVIRREEAKAQK